MRKTKNLDGDEKMPSLYQVRVPAPNDWQEFQRMLCDLFKLEWNSPNTYEFGSPGQSQHGVDIYGFPNQGQDVEGIQCKCVTTLTAKDIRDEYNKSLGFSPQLGRYIIATTVSRDRNLQTEAIRLSQTGSYPCEILFWEDICQLLATHREILEKYYPDFFITKSIGEAPGKVISIDIEENHYELLISKIDDGVSHYGGLLLVSDLLNKKSQTFRIGDHWSRLEGFIGYGKYDAFVITEWLNSIDIDNLLTSENAVFQYNIPSESKAEFFKSIS